MSKLKFMQVKDLTNDRVSSLSYGGKNIPATLTVLGNLPHNTVISFDQKNAKILIDWLQKNILGD